MGRKGHAGYLGDRLSPKSRANHSIVVEHGNAVGGTPHVALESCGAEASREREGLEGVLGRMSPRAAMREGDRRSTQWREEESHDGYGQFGLWPTAEKGRATY